MKPDLVRVRAWEILVAVHGGADLDPLLDAALDEFPLGRDRAFLAGLVRGTLQWQGRFDHVITVFAARKAPRDPGLLCLLRLALFQLLSLDGVPPFAAIDQAVGLCKGRVSVRSSGFVNGLLRNVLRRLAPADTPEGKGDLQGRLRELFEPLKREPGAFQAAWYSLPRWLTESWVLAYGVEATEDLCIACNEPVPLDLHLLQGEVTADLVASLDQSGCPVVPLTVRGGMRATGHPGRLLIREILAAHPELIVQDATVQEATIWLTAALAEVPLPLPVLDMCAAPGGKTAHLMALEGGPPKVLAMELDPRRTQLLAETLQRTGTDRAVILQADGTRPPLRPGSCGAVLLDGPCSGTGVLRRHPDARWRLRPQVVGGKARVLLKLAEQAVELLAPGGVLMYATCSLQPGENQDVVDALMRRHGDLAPFPDGSGLWRRTWLPPAAPGDGFFAARLLKRRNLEGLSS